MGSKTYSKWYTASYCSKCKGIDTFDGAYITCTECGSIWHSFKSIRNVFDKTVFLKYFSYPKFIGHEIIEYNSLKFIKR